MQKLESEDRFFYEDPLVADVSEGELKILILRRGNFTKEQVLVGAMDAFERITERVQDGLGYLPNVVIAQTSKRVARLVSRRLGMVVQYNDAMDGGKVLVVSSETRALLENIKLLRGSDILGNVNLRLARITGEIFERAQ